MFRKSLKSRLMMYFFISILLPSLLVGFFSYQTSKSTIQEKISQSATSTGMSANDSLSILAESKKQDTAYLSQLISADFPKEVNLSIMKEFKDQHPEVDKIVMGNKDGSYMIYPEVKLDKFNPLERPWYKDAMKTEDVAITEPYISAEKQNGEKLVLAFSKKIHDNSGVVAIVVDTKNIATSFSNMKIGNQGFVYLLSAERNYIYHPNHKAMSKEENKVFDEIYQNEKGDFTYKDDKHTYTGYYTKNPVTNWEIVTVVSDDEIKSETLPLLITNLIITLFSLIVVGILVFFILRQLFKPILHLSNAAKQISEGNLNVVIQSDSHDEVGVLGKSFTLMVNNLKEMIDKISDTTSQMAASSEELSASADETAHSSEHVANEIQSLAAQMEQQVVLIEKTNTSMKQMQESTESIQQNMIEMTGSSNKTTEITGEGSNALVGLAEKMITLYNDMQDISGAIGELNNKSSQIEKLVVLIDEIANQTNLLSLNASIEAARAGEAGRGFMVVANEVKKLAVQTSDSSKEIRNLISSIQTDITRSVDKTNTGVQNMESGMVEVENAQLSFNKIQDSISQLSAMIQEISYSTKDLLEENNHITSNVVDFTKGTEMTANTAETISAASQQQLAVMEEMSTAARSVSILAEELQAYVNRFNV